MDRVVRYYRLLALILLNTLVLFALANVVLYLVFRVRDLGQARAKNRIYERYGIGPRELVPLYPGMSEEDITGLLSEAWSVPYVYEPLAGFKEQPTSGRYVNISPHGFRMTKDQGPWPPDRSRYLTIFLFGGSTTFGYGVADGQTIASSLQALLPSRLGPRQARVYNFGRSYYFSTQEMALFAKLLEAGHVPDIAIFVDGLNEFVLANDDPIFSDQMARYYREAQAERDRSFQFEAIARASKFLPILQAAAALRQKYRSEQRATSGTEEQEGLARHRLERYARNRKIIEGMGVAFGVKTAFVWQPVWVYGYDTKYHMFAKGGFQNQVAASYGYRMMAERRASEGENFFWCADIQEGVKQPLYVDKIHYSPKMSGMVASCIADFVFGPAGRTSELSASADKRGECR